MTYVTVNYDCLQCAAQTGVDFSLVMKCYRGKQGDELIDMYANRTAALQPPLSWVPTVVFNDVRINNSDFIKTTIISIAQLSG